MFLLQRNPWPDGFSARSVSSPTPSNQLPVTGSCGVQKASPLCLKRRPTLECHSYSLSSQAEADLYLRWHPCLAFFFPIPCLASLWPFLLRVSLNKSLAQESPFQGQSGFPRNKDRYLGCQLISAFRLHKIWSCCVFYSRILHNLFFKNNNPSLIELVWGL